MKFIMSQNHNFFLILWFLSINFNAFSQVKIENETVPCNLILNKASAKYNVIFNYNYKDLEAIFCLDELPSTFSKFRELLEDYSGLLFESYSNEIWIVKKNYSHQIKFIDINHQPAIGFSLLKYGKTSNRFGNVFIQVEQYPEKLVFTHPYYMNHEVLILDSTPKMIQTEIIQLALSEVILNNLYIKGVFLSSENHIKVKPKFTPLLAGQVQQDAFVSLLNLPQISTSTESIAELNIKGGVNDQNLVLWNGIKLFQNAHFFGLLSAFNDNLIETITVIDNATPAQYGNALSGTVKLDFDSNFANKSSYGVGLNALSSHAFLRQKLDHDYELSFAIQRSFTNLLQTPTFEAYRQKVYQDTEIELSENQSLDSNIKRVDVFYYQDAQFQLKKRFNKKLSLQLHGIWFENDLDYQERSNNMDNKSSNFNNLNSALGVNALYQWDDMNDVKFIYNISKHISEGNNNTFTGNLNTFQNNSIDNYYLQLHWTHKKDKYKFTSGFDFDGAIVSNQFNNKVTSASLNLVQVGNTYAGFNDFSFKDKKWSIYTGIRHVYYQRDDQFQLEPRFNVTYRFNDFYELSLRGEKKSQNLKQIIDLDQNFLGIEKRRWFLSGQNESELQRSNQLETILKFDKNRFGGFASFFIRQMKGLSSDDQRFQNQNQFNSFESGTSQILGSMLHFFYKDKIINTWLSFAYLNEKIATPEQDFLGNNNLNYHITWGNNLRFQKWNFSFSFIYHDGLPFTSVNKINPIITNTTSNISNINYNKPNNEKLPDYFRMDASMQYEHTFKFDQTFKFSLSIINFANRNNILRRNYRLNRVNANEIQEIETRGLGFTPNFGILHLF